MSFLAPAAFFFLLTIPVIVILYLLKKKRVQRLVPSSILWNRFIAESQANRPFQKLRKNLLMVLQIIATLALIFALARPYFQGDQRISNLNILILDNSASMQSQDESPNRFQVAKRQALDVVNSMKKGEQALILVAGPQAETALSATSRVGPLRRAIQDLETTDGPAAVEDSLRLAKALIQDRVDASVHLFSDGALPEFETLENTEIPLVYHKVGSRMNNIGITSVDVRSNPENESERAIFASVRNYTNESVQANLEFYFEDELLDIQSLALTPTNATPTLLIYEQSEDGVIKLHLDHEDDLEADNDAYAVSRLRGKMRTLLVSPGNQYLERALNALPHIELYTATQYEGGEEELDMIVLDGVTPPVWPTSANLFVFNTQAPNWFDSVETIEAPPIVQWDASHPLLRFVTLDGILIGQSQAVSTPDWGDAIVETTDHPLIIAGSRGPQRIVWVGFDTLESTWLKEFTFPIFATNVTHWLDASRKESELLTLQSGEPLQFSVANPGDNASVVDPKGNRRSIEIDPDSGAVVFGATSQRGIYQLTTGTNSIPFVVNTASASESENLPSDEIRLGTYNVAESEETREAHVEIWRWILVAGLLFLLFEWWYYHKRTV